MSGGEIVGSDFAERRLDQKPPVVQVTCGLHKQFLMGQAYSLYRQISAPQIMDILHASANIVQCSVTLPSC